VQKYNSEIDYSLEIEKTFEKFKQQSVNDYKFRYSKDAGMNHIETNIIKRVFSKKSPSYTFFIEPSDESGARIISEIENRGINLAANALAQSSDHIYSFLCNTYV